MTAVKRILIILFAILTTACVAIDTWYVFVRLYGKDKAISNTYEVGLQESTDGTQNHFIEIKYNSNKNKNGLEMFEIKFNTLLDENKSGFYSQGLQFVANEINGSINWSYNRDPQQTRGIKFDEKNGWWNGKRYYAWFGSYALTDGTMYNYASGDNYLTTIQSTNPISNDSMFRVQLGQDLFQMKFRGDNTPRVDDNFVSSKNAGYQYNGVYGYTKYEYDYTYYNAINFAHRLYNSVQTLAGGTEKIMIFEFGNLFDYYKYEGDGVYSSTAISDSTKVITLMRSYYSIKVSVSADGARNAQSDSLFNTIHGTSNYNTSGDYTNSDYFYGRTVIECTEDDFVAELVDETSYKLRLSNTFLTKFHKYASQLVLNITINLDNVYSEYDKSTFTFVGLSDNLNDFEINEAYTNETIDGQVVRTELGV